MLEDLREEGFRVGKKRVARLMQRGGLQGRAPRRFVRTTDSNHTHPIAPNLLQRQFDVNGMAVDRVWVSDITYVPTGQGWLYLAVVVELASRRVIGWSMRDSLEAELALSALRMALTARQPEPGLIHHSDRGIQYACDAYRELLAAHDIQPSMSRVGDCWDNAVAESFFATLELELIARRNWRTHAEARQAIFYLHRDVLQSETPAFNLGLRQPSAVRTATQDGRLTILNHVSTKTVKPKVRSGLNLVLCVLRGLCGEDVLRSPLTRTLEHEALG